MNRTYAHIWWGPPRKFTIEKEERKISWLELFYDLVYVIVISRITHHLAEHTDWQGLLQFFYLFMLAFWGWANGSQYHDLHGSPGIRTRFMTLWQMMAVAAFAVTLNSPPDVFLFRTTIALVVLQGFITYLWWSVGIYDKEHRKLSRPYIYCYVSSFILLILSLFLTGIPRSVLFWIIPILNFAPPFFNQFRLDSRFEDYNLSSSMVERLGLITIIVFGENILGVIHGLDHFPKLNATIWLAFGLGILIVFLLWWMFFALVADRTGQKGFWNSQKMILVYIPTLGSLGAVGATFSVILNGMYDTADHHVQLARGIFGIGLTVFIWSVWAISKRLVYPAEYDQAKKIIQPLLLIIGVLILIITMTTLSASIFILFISVFVLLLAMIVLTTVSWFKVEVSNSEVNIEQKTT
jgi:hypothetical protein